MMIVHRVVELDKGGLDRSLGEALAQMQGIAMGGVAVSVETMAELQAAGRRLAVAVVDARLREDAVIEEAVKQVELIVELERSRPEGRRAAVDRSLLALFLDLPRRAAEACELVGLRAGVSPSGSRSRRSAHNEIAYRPAAHDDDVRALYADVSVALRCAARLAGGNASAIGSNHDERRWVVRGQLKVDASRCDMANGWL
jgi:hypothetical protein